MIEKILGQNGIIEKILNSRAFLWVCGLITFISWFTGIDFIGILILFSLATLVFIFCKNTIPAMSIFCLLFFCISTKDLSFEESGIWGIIAIFPVIGMIVNLIRFKAQFKLQGFTFATILCILPWLFMGINVEGRDSSRVLICIAVAMGILLLYLFFAITTRESGDKLIETFAHILLVISSVLFLEIISFYLRLGNIDNFIQILSDNITGLHLGWGGRNNASTLLSLAMPLTFYYATKKNKLSFLFIIYGMLQYFAILLIKSRGAMIFTTIFMPLLIIYSIVKAKNKLSTSFGYLIVVLGAVLIYFKFDDIFVKLFSRFAEYGLNGVGREDLYIEGLTLFSKYPVFGIGFDYKSVLFFIYVPNSNGASYYHSTFIQILASFGLFGGAFYFYLYYWRYRLVFTDISSVKIAMLIGMLMFESYNLIDTNFFQPQGYIIMLFISLVMEKSLARSQTLPLIIKGFDLLKIKKQYQLKYSKEII